METPTVQHQLTNDCMTSALSLSAAVTLTASSTRLPLDVQLDIQLDVHVDVHLDIHLDVQEVRMRKEER